MRKAEFERLLWTAIKAFWCGDACGRDYERALDYLALDCTDEQWQIVDDTLGLCEDPDGYIVDGMTPEPSTSPF